ncbi:MAG: restriction endonuclease subunit S [Syntrophobacteraceae bacterium]
MRQSYPRIRIGEILKLDIDSVPVNSTETYQFAGVYSFGKGLFIRGYISGSETTYKKFHRLHHNQFVMSQPKGWEGALARVTKDFDGLFLSPVYPTFSANEAKLNIRFLELFFKQNQTWNSLDRLSKGMGARRNSVYPEMLLSMEIPLPPLLEQRRIVAKIEQLAAKIEELQYLRAGSASAAQGFLSQSFAKVFPKPQEATLGHYVNVQSGYAFKSEWFSGDGIRLVRNVNIGHGTIDWSQVARIPFERSAEFERFELAFGDILVSLDRPLISTGVKIASVRKQDLPSLLLQRVGRLRLTNDHLEPDYLFLWLNSPHFANGINPGRSNGVPHISPKDIERIPFTAPSIKEQRRIVTYLKSVQARAGSLKALQTQTAAELNALFPSILDKAFRGEL